METYPYTDLIMAADQNTQVASWRRQRDPRPTAGAAAQLRGLTQANSPNGSGSCSRHLRL